ncbi:MAG: hypothetical protein JSW26_00100 [Desulfobacterales bacterium]|nr:MAG: hypothetical protein JSW26_00100 [Desulfobacterales bacterium]
MGLLDRLQDGFSFSLDGITTELNSVSPDAPAIDTDGLAQAAGPLGGINLGPITASLTTVVQQGQSGLGTLADVSGLLTPLTGILDRADSFQSSDPRALLDRLQNQTGEREGNQSGLDFLNNALQQVQNFTSDSTVNLATELVSTLSGGAVDVSSTLPSITGKTSALTQIVGSLAGLTAIWSQVQHISETAERLEALLPTEDIGLVRDQLTAWFTNNDLIQRIESADGDDVATVGELTAIIQEYVAAIRAYHSHLQKALGFGEATLVHADLADAVARIGDAGRMLQSYQVAEPIRNLTVTIQEWLLSRLPSDWSSIDTPIDELTDRFGTLIDDLVATVNDFDVQSLTRPVSSAINQVTDIIAEINNAMEAVAGAIRSAMTVVRDLIEGLNLQGVAETIRTVIRPVAEVIDTLDGLLGDSLTAIETAMTTATAAITAAKTAVLAEAETVKGAFDNIASELDTVLDKLPGVLGQVEDGIQSVADTLKKIDLTPYFDTSVDVMETAATVIDAVPIDILPDDVEADLQEAVKPVKAIDFEEVKNTLISALTEIRTSFDEDVLGEIDAIYQDIIAFLQDNNPRGPIEDLEATVFDEFLARLRAVDPDVILQPIADVIDQAKAAIASIDLRADILEEVDGVFDEILAYYDQLDPTALFAPVTDRIDAVRGDIKELTGIESWTEHLDSIVDQLKGVLDNVDLANWVPKIEAQFDTLLIHLRSQPSANPIAGNLVAALSGDGVRVSAFDEVAEWLKGEPGAERVITGLTEAVGRLNRVADGIAELGVEGVVSQASSWHRSLVSAIEGKSGTALHGQVALLVNAHNPQAFFAPILAYGPRYNDELRARLAEIQSLATSGFSQVTTVAEALRDGLRPLVEVKQRFAELLRQFGVDPAGKTALEIIADIFGTLRPAILLGPLQGLVDALKAKVVELVETGLIDPVKSGVVELQSLIDNIDINPIVNEIAAVHSALRDEINALRPSALLGEPLTEFEELQATIAAYDPLSPVRTTIDAFKAAVEEVAGEASPLRPTVMLGSLLATYDDILAAAGELNIRDMLKPLLDELEGISGQLDEGLERSAAALKKLQDALP